jgi:hypothetical protein
VLQLGKACAQDEVPPGLRLEKRPVAVPIVTLDISPPGIRAEEHTARLQAGIEVPQYTTQFLRWDMKKRCIGEHAIKRVFGELQVKEILMPYLTSCPLSGHFDKRGTAVQANGVMSEFSKCQDVSSRTTS